jgi:hypothetical protein
MAALAGGLSFSRLRLQKKGMMLIDFVLDVVGYTTSRLLIPALTFQKVKVDALSSGKAGFNWLGFKRLPDGALLCDSNTAGWFGTIFWLIALAIIIAITMR